MANIVYYNIHKAFAEGTVDFDGHVLKCALLQNTYPPDRDDKHFSDVSSHELSALYGYTSGGNTVTGASITLDTDDNVSVFSCDELSWTATGGVLGDPIPMKYAVLYDDTTVNKDLIYLIDFSGDKQVEPGLTFRIRFNGSHLFTVG